MNVLKWLPWKSLARRTAQRHGFVDPITLFDRMREFAQPSEVGEPIELLRAGAAFHARGLLNRAIQFNLDWVWPYWVERQFNPEDESFVPRAFSFSHINLTHRNWTAVGLPDVPLYPIVDPRGLVTPLFDGWSLDFWIIDAEGSPLLLPSRAKSAEQRVEVPSEIQVRTRIADDQCSISTRVFMEPDGCVVEVLGTSMRAARLVAAVRPYNPEGISFVDSIEALTDGHALRINNSAEVVFDSAPERVALACYKSGDVLRELREKPASQSSIRCPAGMATAAAVFPVGAKIEVRVPFISENNARDNGSSGRTPAGKRRSLREELGSYARLEIPQGRWKELYDTALATVVLHSPAEVYPGPYTYKRFWYRDAALILHALASVGGRDRCRKALDLFPRGQLADGYFRSQEGEWDSNGEVLWIIDRALALSGEPLPAHWEDMVERGARWILRKRLGPGSPHPGLLPAGFSAEHLGLNDFYYWDDFWAVAGLRSAARLLGPSRPHAAREFSAAADEFLKTIDDSVARSSAFRELGAIPAAPDRRMDSGAIGSLVADYPLALYGPGDDRIIRAAEWLMRHSFTGGGFFQNMIHSGINAYLTIHVAQVLLRAGDPRAHDLLDTTARLASPTGQWPEAIHPRTLGGCMGDGQHVWAAAEWILAMRSLFVREEKDTLVIGAGLRREWLSRGAVSFGPTETAFGPLTVRAALSGPNVTIDIMPRWHGNPPQIQIAFPGLTIVDQQSTRFTLTDPGRTGDPALVAPKLSSEGGSPHLK